MLSLYLQVCLLASLAYTLKTIFTSDKAKIKSTLKDFIREKNLINSSNQKVQVDSVELIETGFKAVLDISAVTDFTSIEKQQDYLKQLFRASQVELKNREGKVILEVITKAITKKDFKQVKLKPTQLLLGFNAKGENIILDMLKTPHVHDY